MLHHKRGDRDRQSRQRVRDSQTPDSESETGRHGPREVLVEWPCPSAKISKLGLLHVVQISAGDYMLLIRYVQISSLCNFLKD